MELSECRCWVKTISQVWKGIEDEMDGRGAVSTDKLERLKVLSQNLYTATAAQVQLITDVQAEYDNDPFGDPFDND